MGTKETAFRNALQSVCDSDMQPYIDICDDDDFVLDGHFTLAQLEAIVTQIKLHNTPER